jgi:large subunit ribosomal protein L24
MGNLHVKNGDEVLVIAGGSKGKKGKIIEVNPAKGAVRVENVNVGVYHKKPRSGKEQGGRLTEARFINSSNVQVICPVCNKPTRVGHTEVEEDGKKRSVRVCTQEGCGAVLDSKVESVRAKRERRDKERAARKEKKAKKVKTEETAEVKSDDAEVKVTRKSKKTEKTETETKE